MVDYSGLNSEQSMVVNNQKDNILLLASAGTGKTNTMIYRIINILDKKLAKPEEILCLTFTNKAAQELKKRLWDNLPAGVSSKVRASTFHGFCYYFLKQEVKKESDIPEDFTIIDETDCQELLREIFEGSVWHDLAAKEHCEVNMAPFMYNIQHFINYVRELCAVHNYYGLTRRDYNKLLQIILHKKEYLERLNEICSSQYKSDNSFLKHFFNRCGAVLWQLYEEALLDMHALDFTDLLIGTLQLLQDKEIRERWQKRYHFINVDEMQDTNQLEYAVLKILFFDNNILCCGDYYQTIYEWRGSSPDEIFADFVQNYQAKIIMLNTNYRATNLLLHASFSYIQNLFPKTLPYYNDDIHAASSQEGEKIYLKNAFDFADEAEWILGQIRAMKLTTSSSICILTRSNNYSINISNYYQKRMREYPATDRLNFMLVDKFQFFRRQEVKDVLAYLRLCVNKYDGQSFMRILKRFRYGIGPTVLKRLTSADYLDLGIRLTDFLDVSVYQYGEPFALLEEELKKGNVVVFDVESTGVDTTQDEIIQIAAIRINATGKIIDTFMRYLRADKSVGDSEKVHHISDAFLQENGEDASQVLQEFTAFAQNSVVVGHNVGYDLKMLYNELWRLHLPPVNFLGSYDTLDIFRRFYPHLPNYKLEFLGEYFKIESRSSHDALDDVRATAELLHYVWIHNIQTTRYQRLVLLQDYLTRFRPVAEKMWALREFTLKSSLEDTVTNIITKYQVKDYYEKQKDGKQRMENLRLLYRWGKQIGEGKDNPFTAVLELLQVSVLAKGNIDLYIKKYAMIPIITVHQAKGSEFDYVFVAGLTDGIFPNYLAIQSGRIEEEKRLFYVAITRAKKRLFLSWHPNSFRMSEKSRFLQAINKEYIKVF